MFPSYLERTAAQGGQQALALSAATASAATSGMAPFLSPATTATSVALAALATATETDVASISLAPATVPAARTAHSLCVRARVQTLGTGVTTLRMALYEGATNRSGNLESAQLTTSLAEYTLPIPDSGAAAISDYSNLTVYFWGYSALGDVITVEVADVWLFLPVATGGVPAGWLTRRQSTTSASSAMRPSCCRLLPRRRNDHRSSERVGATHAGRRLDHFRHRSSNLPCPRSRRSECQRPRPRR